MSNGFLVWVKTDSERHKTLHNAEAILSCSTTLTCDSGQDQAEDEEPRHGPGASHLPHYHRLAGLITASDWPRASILASDWPAADDNHSVSRHVTDSPGGNALLVVTRILSH